MANSKYAPKHWQSDRFDVECPSGQLCLARKMQMDDIVALGLIDELDTFSDFASNMETASEKTGAELADSFMGDPKMLEKVIDIADRIVARCVVEPQIELPYTESKKGKRTPLKSEDREEGVVYTDYVGFEDKMYIFNAVFGENTIDQFREESS